MLRTGVLHCKDRAPFDRTQAHTVIARRCELVIVIGAHPAVCEVALDCASAGEH
jgi:hypothetical protein